MGERPELKQRSVVLVRESPRGEMIVACSDRASARGVAVGMTLAEARSLRKESRGHSLVVLRENRQSARTALIRLAWTCQSCSPCVGVEEADAPESLLLDISSCAHLFGGEEPLLQQVQETLQGFTLRLGVADAIGAAWALAHYGQRNVAVAPPEKHHAALRDFPVDALRIAPKTAALLHRLGIDRIADLQKLPRQSIPSRFGEELLRRLDQATGRRPELITPETPPSPVEAEREFEYPVDNLSTLESVLLSLLRQVVAESRRRRLSIRRIDCRLRCESGGEHKVAVELLRPSLSEEHLCQLLKLQWERIQISRPVITIDVAAQLAPLVMEQTSLFDDNLSSDTRVAELIDRLSNRLGVDAVLRATLFPDAQPEFAYRLESLLHARRMRDASNRSSCKPLHRPLCLLQPPVAVRVVSADARPCRLYWSQREHHVVCSWGPERISTGWWRRHPVRRDYYSIETREGARYWLFRSGNAGDWFLHGVFE